MIWALEHQSTAVNCICVVFAFSFRFMRRSTIHICAISFCVTWSQSYDQSFGSFFSALARHLVSQRHQPVSVLRVTLCLGPETHSHAMLQAHFVRKNFCDFTGNFSDCVSYCTLCGNHWKFCVLRHQWQINHYVWPTKTKEKHMWGSIYSHFCLHSGLIKG